MLGPRADVAEAQLTQQFAHRALVVGDAVSLRDEALQVNAPPAHHPMHRPIRARLDELSHFGLLLRRQAGRVALGPGILEGPVANSDVGCRTGWSGLTFTLC
jgi:hypothetical protein